MRNNSNRLHHVQKLDKKKINEDMSSFISNYKLIGTLLNIAKNLEMSHKKFNSSIKLYFQITKKYNLNIEKMKIFWLTRIKSYEFVERIKTIPSRYKATA